MADNLIERLRQEAREIRNLEMWPETYTALEDAVTRIETLERELSNLRANTIHTCNDQCQRPLCVLQRDNAGLRKALEPFARLAERILAEAPADAEKIVLFSDSQGFAHTVSMDELRGAQAALKDAQ